MRLRAWMFDGGSWVSCYRESGDTGFQPRTGATALRFASAGTTRTALQSTELYTCVHALALSRERRHREFKLKPSCFSCRVVFEHAFAPAFTTGHYRAKSKRMRQSCADTG